MLLFCDGAHGEPVRAVAAVLREHVARIEDQVATVRSITRASRPIVAVGADVAQRLLRTPSCSREKYGITVCFTGYTIASMTALRCPSPYTLV